jgi:3-dehydroquinate synthase
MKTEIVATNKQDILKIIDGHDYIMVDVNILDLYPAVREILKHKNCYVLSEPEESKNIKEFSKCCEFFLERNIRRCSKLLALGGGATSDLAGYVASSLLRGVAWNVIPTTLLSMIDAAIGGKTAINSKFGKNLIGAFHRPLKVYINEDFLETLAKDDLNSGMGELVKYTILDRDIYAAVNSDHDLKDIILKCAEYKNELVELDFKEDDKRKLLNLGHTLGHAIEYKYQINHGQSVLFGLHLIHKVFSKNAVVNLIEQAAEKLNLSLDYSFVNRSELMNFIIKDKKIIENNIDVILANAIGDVEIETISLKTLEAKLK